MIGTCCILGRASRTKETLPDFHEWCRVTRHLRIFHELMGYQRTPGIYRYLNFTDISDISGYIDGYFYIKFSIIQNYSKFKNIFNLHIIIILKLERMIISISF